MRNIDRERHIEAMAARLLQSGAGTNPSAAMECLDAYVYARNLQAEPWTEIRSMMLSALSRAEEELLEELRDSVPRKVF